MGLLTLLLTGRPYGATYEPTSDFWYKPDPRFGGGTTEAGMLVSPESSMRLGAVFACVGLIADMVGSLPLILYRRLEDDGKERATTQPLYNVLRRRPNVRQTAKEWRTMGTAHLLLRGNFYNRLVVDGRGAITELQPLHPDRVTVRLLDSGRRGYTYRPPRGNAETYTQDEIHHVMGLSLDGVTGCSVIEYARESVGAAQAQEGFAARFWRQGAEGHLAFVAPGPMSDLSRKANEEALQARVGGWQNAHKALLLEGGLKPERISVTGRDAQYIESRKFSVSDIARFFRVPPHMIGDVDGSTSWGCLPSSTPVFTVTGPRAIADIEPGEEVWSLGADALVPSKVTAKRMTGVRPCLTVHTTARALRLTDNHQLPVRRYESIGNHGRSERGTAGWTTQWVRADEIRVGDFVAVPHGTHGVGDVAPNGRRLTVEAMELCGLYLGNGSLDGNRIEIAHATAADCLPYYRDAIAREFSAAPYTSATRTRFSSIEARDLLECGFTGTAYTKRVPGWVFTLTRELRLALLRGYLDSDGSVQHGVISYSSAHRELLEDMRHLCMSVAVPVGRVYVGRRAGSMTIRGRTYATRAKYVLALSSTSSNAAIGSRSPKKQARFRASETARALRHERQWRGGVVSKKSHLSPVAGWPYRDVLLQRVTAIETSTIAEPVWDLEVEGTESFIADGVIVHNSGIEQQTIGFVNFTLLPWLVSYEQAIYRDCIDDPEFFAEFLVDALLRGESATRATAHRTYVDGGIKSVNEVRVLENLNPLDGEEFDLPHRAGNIGGDPQGGDPATSKRPATAPTRPPATPPEEDDAVEGEAEVTPAPIAARKVVIAAAERLVRKEIAAIEKRAPRFAGDTAGWREWVTSFYGRHVDELVEALCLDRDHARRYGAQHCAELLEQGVSVLEAWRTEAPTALVALTAVTGPPMLEVADPVETTKYLVWEGRRVAKVIKVRADGTGRYLRIEETFTRNAEGMIVETHETRSVVDRVDEDLTTSNGPVAETRD